MKKLMLLFLLAFVSISCNSKNSEVKVEKKGTMEVSEEAKAKKLNLNGNFENMISGGEFNIFKRYIFSNIVVDTKFRKIPIGLKDIEELTKIIDDNKKIVLKFKKDVMEKPEIEADKYGIELADNLLEQYEKAYEVLNYYKNEKFKEDDYAQAEKLLLEYEKLVLKERKLKEIHDRIINKMSKERENYTLEKLEKKGLRAEKTLLIYLYSIRDFDVLLEEGYHTGFSMENVNAMKGAYSKIQTQLSELKKVDKQTIEKEKLDKVYTEIIDNSQNINKNIEKIFVKLSENSELNPDLVSTMNEYSTVRSKTITAYNSNN
jgi:lipoprotein